MKYLEAQAERKTETVIKDTKRERTNTKEYKCRATFKIVSIKK